MCDNSYDPAVPTLAISTKLLILEYNGNTSASNSTHLVTCIPSDLRAPVRWRALTAVNNTVPLFQLQATFSPVGFNHSLTFPRVFNGSPPNRTYMLVCDLLSPDVETNDSEVFPQYVIVRFLQSKFTMRLCS